MVNSVARPWQLLIADDNRSFRAALREVLAHFFASLELHEADSGEEAVDLVKQQRIDIALLDLHMHAMTGIDALKALKRLDAVRPCILITSDANEEVRRDAQDAEAFAVLRKPVERQALITSVATAISTAYRTELS